MHLYNFGSIVRGEIDLNSDIDILAIVEEYDTNLDANKFSIYSYERIKEIWIQGNPFAWHLYLESNLIFSSNETDFLRDIGEPSHYNRVLEDCLKFKSIFETSRQALQSEDSSAVFELSCIFLAMRNFAICYSLQRGRTPNFSRKAALKLESESLVLEDRAFKILESCRLLSTRGVGYTVQDDSINLAKRHLDTIQNWMNNLMKKLDHE